MTASQAVLTLNLPSRNVNQKSTKLLKGKEVSKKHLINALNHINFKEESVTLVFTEPYNDASFRIEAYPMPVLSDYPTFKPLQPLPQGVFPEHLTGLIIPDGNGEIHAIPLLRASSSTGLSIVLPKTGQRVQCSYRDIRVHFLQRGIKFKGSLTSLEPDTIEITLSPLSAHYLSGIIPEEPLNLTFCKKKIPLFQTEARFLKKEYHGESVIINLKPAKSIPDPHTGQCFGKKSFEMIPAPDFVFSHPLTETVCTAVIDSLSAVDMHLTLHQETPPLIPGMLLEDAAITLGDLYRLPLTAQVTKCCTQKYKAKKEEKCHISFLEMSPENHRKLQTMVHKAENKDIRICYPLEEDDLWRFFFETGFIYKNKYRLFLENKKNIKKTYETIYSTPSNVTCHVAYQENGRTMGHISMLRYSEGAWLVHHHAALKGASIRVGLGVLNQIGNYIIASQYIQPECFKYLICYFRPENHFPNFFFDGFRKKKNDPKICSSDLFAYVYFKSESNDDTKFPDEWKLNEATEKDLTELEAYYNQTSKGMLIEALDLFQRQASFEVLRERYSHAGLNRNRQIWAIRHKNVTAAILIVNTSDIALNMSELTNCIKVCIIRPDILDKQTLTNTLNILIKNYKTHRTPVLIHPLDWVDRTGFNYQKRYHFWVLNNRFFDDFMQHVADTAPLSHKSH
ncbi:hypothetical protein [Desulfoluna butyratoxydans]|uniref:Acyl-coa n-acyltransferase n=1 Tax=Desulfoluna butyratoxydans TaxID=231438 RepID=A0A4U8YY39_9BACT|nr:hypothetical protein [Desulfoluna butyratoxydans]VFQ47012.1 hypothetical protein MSL71_46940 [Desulfoluna butyratoxydans]